MAYFVRRLGGETRVNTSVTGEQGSLTFRQLSDGRLLATWTGTGTQPGQEDDYGLFHQVFGADFNRIGGEVRSNSTPTGIQRYPSILTLADGRWACVWNDDIGSNTTTYDGIFVQPFNSTGRIGGATRLDGPPHSPGRLAGTRKLADGGFMVLWEGESTQTGIQDDGIFYQRFDGNGTATGSVSRVNTTAEGRHWVPRFVELSGGAFGVAWNGKGTQPGHEDNDGAYFQRFDADGNPVGSEILINNPTSDITEFPGTSIGLKDGGWVLTYYDAFGSRDQAWQQVFNADGSKRGGPTKLTPEGGTGTSATARLVALGDGKWVTFWEEGESYLSSDIHYQVFNADGSAAGPKSLATASTEGMQGIYSILGLPNGGFMVVWNGKGTQPGQDDTDGHFFQRFDASGAKVGGETRINTTTEGEVGNLEIAVLPTGHIVAVWDNYVSQPGQPSEVDIFQQVFDANGNRVGAESRVATSTAGPQRNPQLKVLTDGSWIVSWSGNGTQPGQEDAHVNGTESGGAFFQRFTLFEGAAPPFDLVLVGTGRADKLVAGHGHDRLYGKAGKDVLTGAAGADVFVFDTKPNKKTNLDTITDYSPADDTIWLNDRYFKKLGKGSEANPKAVKKAFFKAADKAKDGNDYLVYSKKKGILFYDADGSGSGKAVEIAKLSKNLKLTAADFFVV